MQAVPNGAMSAAPSAGSAAVAGMTSAGKLSDTALRTVAGPLGATAVLSATPASLGGGEVAEGEAGFSAYLADAALPTEAMSAAAAPDDQRILSPEGTLPGPSRPGLINPQPVAGMANAMLPVTPAEFGDTPAPAPVPTQPDAPVTARALLAENAVASLPDAAPSPDDASAADADGPEASETPDTPAPASPVAQPPVAQAALPLAHAVPHTRENGAAMIGVGVAKPQDGNAPTVPTTGVTDTSIASAQSESSTVSHTDSGFSPLIDTGATKSTAAQTGPGILPFIAERAVGPLAPPPAAPRHPVIPGQPGRIGESLGVEIAKRMTDGGDELTVRLDPAHLGQIEVRMRIDEAGQLRATITSSQPATLDMLRRDSGDLLRAINDAGIGTDSASFQFDTRGQGQHGGYRGTEPRSASPERVSFEDPASPSPNTSPALILASGRVNMVA